MFVVLNYRRCYHRCYHRALSSLLSFIQLSFNQSSFNHQFFFICHSGDAILNLLKLDIKPRDIMTKKAFENAITIVMVLGGSTNAVLHLIAMARAVNVDLTLDDFQRISDKTPFLADLKPSGKYVMEDMQRYGGTPAVMRMLLDNGMLLQ